MYIFNWNDIKFTDAGLIGLILKTSTFYLFRNLFQFLLLHNLGYHLDIMMMSPENTNECCKFDYLHEKVKTSNNYLNMK